ncbi:MAG TPA: 1,4-dihydroxy-6-naphthoate synthase [Candidatus Stackebrandtia excrementipullorum]|nr:1,4-dihydroxy-6-naphthoate synthase [Candidatus Stackebrandtia excrementipullorum]
MKLAFSPCPNDTFVFHAWVHGLIEGAPPVDVTFADVDVTNTAALSGAFDVVKVSYAALPWLLDKYRLLPTGGALGHGCGPLVLTRDRRDPTDLAGARIAVPGEKTTAYLLFRLWSQAFAPAHIDVVPFEQIMPGVAAGRFDAGLVIHEARFTYREHGLTMLADLGQWWEHETGHPIPLGAILAKRELDADRITRWIRASVEYAWKNPEAGAAYVAQHAQEMSSEVTRQHIDLYVNEFTADLGTAGHAAVDSLLTRAADAGLVPRV